MWIWRGITWGSCMLSPHWTPDAPMTTLQLCRCLFVFLSRDFFSSQGILITTRFPLSLTSIFLNKKIELLPGDGTNVLDGLVGSSQQIHLRRAIGSAFGSSYQKVADQWRSRWDPSLRKKTTSNWRGHESPRISRSGGQLFGEQKIIMWLDSFWPWMCLHLLT